MTNDSSDERQWAQVSSLGKTCEMFSNGKLQSRRIPSSLVATVAAAVVTTGTFSLAPSASASPSWPTYHGDNTRSGNDTAEEPLSPLQKSWSSNLDGTVFGQPLVQSGRVVAATEADSVYALDAHDGAVLWRSHLGTPLTNVVANTGCGNIDPLGITSTPVIDPATSTIYTVAEVVNSSGVHHRLFGLDLYTGAVKVNADADPPSDQQNPLHIQQRSALALAGGRIYIGYGGLAGDCGTYHGFVVSLDTSGGNKLSFNTTPKDGLGAVWSPGGPAVDNAGNIYVASGNPNANPSRGNYGESVIELSTGLGVRSAFSSSNATADSDLGSVTPALLGANLLFQIGKQQTGYLLDTTDLTNAIETLANTCPPGVEAFGATAWDGNGHLYVPCTDGIQQVDVNTSARTVSLGWKADSGADGPPVLADGMVWSASTQNGVLYGLDPATGKVVVRQSVGAALPHFASPTIADGLIAMGTASGVSTFAGPDGPPPPAPPAPPLASCHTAEGSDLYTLAAGDGGIFTFGGSAFCGSLGGQRINQPIVGTSSTPDGGGYWLVARDGGIFTFGDATFAGSTGAMHLNAPIVGMAPTPDGHGYWLVASDGGIFTFGDATFAGSTGAMHLNAPIVGMAPTPDGHGYWLVASDGGIFTFGDATFAGSTGAMHLNAPIVGMAPTPDGHGYWLVASDGGIFTFGDATFAGSTGAMHLNAPIVGMAPTPDGHGYWLVARDGGIFTFGDATFAGSTGAMHLNAPVVGMAAP